MAVYNGMFLFLKTLENLHGLGMRSLTPTNSFLLLAVMEYQLCTCTSSVWGNALTQLLKHANSPTKTFSLAWLSFANDASQNLVMFIDAAPQIPLDEVEKTINHLRILYEKNCGGEYTLDIACKGNPETEI